MRGSRLLTVLGCGVALCACAIGGVFGQTAAPAGTAPPAAVAPTFSLYLQESPVRAALKQLFDAAHVQYSIDNRLTGFETLHITDQPFDEALKILLRSSSMPLAYTCENGVYFIKPRVISPIGIDRVLESDAKQVEKSSPSIDILTLTHADPYDLAALLGIRILATGTRMAGTRAGGAGAPPAAAGASSNGAPGGTGGLGFDPGTLISTDADNDIIRVGR